MDSPTRLPPPLTNPPRFIGAGLVGHGDILIRQNNCSVRFSEIKFGTNLGFFNLIFCLKIETNLSFILLMVHVPIQEVSSKANAFSGPGYLFPPIQIWHPLRFKTHSTIIKLWGHFKLFKSFLLLTSKVRLDTAHKQAFFLTSTHGGGARIASPLTPPPRVRHERSRSPFIPPQGVCQLGTL